MSAPKDTRKVPTPWAKDDDRSSAYLRIDLDAGDDFKTARDALTPIVRDAGNLHALGIDVVSRDAKAGQEFAKRVESHARRRLQGHCVAIRARYEKAVWPKLTLNLWKQTQQQAEHNGKRWIDARTKRGAKGLEVEVVGGPEHRDDGEFLLLLLEEYAQERGARLIGAFIEDGDVGVRFIAGEPDEGHRGVRAMSYPDGSKLLTLPRSESADAPDGYRAWVASGPIAGQMVREFKLQRNTVGGYYRREDPLPHGTIKKLTDHYEWVDVVWDDGEQRRMYHDHTEILREPLTTMQFFTDAVEDEDVIARTIERCSRAVGDENALRHVATTDGKTLWEANGVWCEALAKAAADQNVTPVYVNDSAVLKAPLPVDLLTSVPDRILRTEVEFCTLAPEGDTAAVKWPDGSTVAMVRRDGGVAYWRARGRLALHMVRDWPVEQVGEDRYVVSEAVEPDRVNEVLQGHPGGDKITLQWAGPNMPDDGRPDGSYDVIDVAKDPLASKALRDAFTPLIRGGIKAHPTMMDYAVEAVEQTQAPGERCDFCGAGPTVAHWPVDPFDVEVAWGSRAIRYDTPWAACATCDLLIAEDNWPGLREYAGASSIELGDLTRGMEDDPQAESVVRGSLARLHKAFWEHKTGVRHPVRVPSAGSDASYPEVGVEEAILRTELGERTFDEIGLQHENESRTVVSFTGSDGERWTTVKFRKDVDLPLTLGLWLDGAPKDDVRVERVADSVLVMGRREAGRELARIIAMGEAEVAAADVAEQAVRIVDSIPSLRVGGASENLREVAIRKTTELLRNGGIKEESEPLDAGVIASLLDAVRDVKRGEDEGTDVAVHMGGVSGGLNAARVKDLLRSGGEPPEGTPLTGKTTLRYRYVDGAFEFTPLDRDDVDADTYREAARQFGGDLTEFHDEEVDRMGYRMTGRLGRVMYEKALAGQDIPASIDMSSLPIDTLDAAARQRVLNEGVLDLDADGNVVARMIDEPEPGPVVDFRVFVPRAA